VAEVISVTQNWKKISPKSYLYCTLHTARPNYDKL